MTPGKPPRRGAGATKQNRKGTMKHLAVISAVKTAETNVNVDVDSVLDRTYGFVLELAGIKGKGSDGASEE